MCHGLDGIAIVDPRRFNPIVDGRTPCRTTWKPWDVIVYWYLKGDSSFQGFLGGAGFRPSTVANPLTLFLLDRRRCQKWNCFSSPRSKAGNVLGVKVQTPGWPRQILSSCQEANPIPTSVFALHNKMCVCRYVYIEIMCLILLHTQ